MTTLNNFPAATDLTSERLTLEPLHAEHAEEMAPVLDDPDLHTFIGGVPATLAELRSRYSRQSVGRSADGRQLWFNWILRRADGQTVGTVQATVSAEAETLTADVAWVIGGPYQRQGYAQEAAGAMLTWLRGHGVAEIVAHVHPEHGASAAVARAIGLLPTAMIVDGEVRWRG